MIYEAIQGLCQARATNIKQVEKTLGFGNGTIHCWKNATPRLDKVQKVANYFGVSLDYLTGAEASSISVDARLVASAFDALPKDKQDLLKRYVNALQGC